MSEEPEKIRITADDLDAVQVSAPWPGVAAPPSVGAGTGPRQWGTVSGAPVEPAGAAGSSRGNFFLKSWVYLGLAGLLGSFLAWAICEPGFVDGGAGKWGNIVIFPFMSAAVCVGFAIAESVAERSVQKGLSRGILAVLLGIVLGFIFYIVANIIFTVGIALVIQSREDAKLENPALWLVRAIAWMAFGVTGGIVYGIAGRSGKKCLYGILGGMLGAGIGGFAFDPINMLTGGAAASRCIGMMIFGTMTGVAVGLVESALKNRWLYVSGGPLAGKQFIIYKPLTRFGSEQSNDIYLFKDLSILATHATIELRGSQAFLQAVGPTFVGGQPVSQRVLQNGDLIQIGRYTFQYQEKQAS